MWEQAQQQAYDRGITIFSPDGRLYQVEYAREAVKRGTASLGVRTAEGVVLAADIRSRSALMEARSIEKLHKVDRHVGIASAGHVADGRRLIDFARRDAQVNRLRYDEPIDVETLAKHLSDVVQQYTQLGGTRPFGVALLIGGVTDGKRQLYELDPSGAITEWRAAAIGANRDQIQDHLEGHYADELSLDEGVELALAALAAGREEPLDAEGVNVAVVSAADGRYRTLEPEEVEKHLPDTPDGDAAAADGEEPEDADASDEDEDEPDE